MSDELDYDIDKDDVDAEPETVPHLVLELEGDRQEFPAFPHANQYLLAKHANDLALGGIEATVAVIKLAWGQVQRDQRPRLEAYLEDHGAAEDFTNAVFEAISVCWSGETMLPLAQSQPSSTGTRTT